MNWMKKRVRGRTSKTFKRWVSECGDYRIEWRGEYEPGRWYATVDVGWMWSFAGKRGAYRTQSAAMKAAEYHRRCWERYLVGGRACRAKLKGLSVGTDFRANRIMNYPPAWCAGDPRLAALTRKLPTKISR